MSNMREQLLAKTAGIRKTSAIQKDEIKRNDRTQTAPGLAGALAVAQMRVQELEAAGVASQIAVSEIGPNPWQPRRVFNDSKLSDLAESIREVGLMQPIVVRRAESGYQIVAGERRWRAHKMLGADTIKAVVAEPSDADMAVLALVENVSRDDLSDYEIALSIRQTEKEFPSRARLAEALGLSRSGLYRFLSFAQLPDYVIRDLDLQPNLLGGTAAEAIVMTIRKYGEAGDAAAREIWPLVASGKMDQGKAAGAIKALATRRAEAASSASERSIDKFFSGKEHAGSITKDVNGFTVKIKGNVLSEALETQIRQLISETFHHQPK
ncbi:Plasmid partition protein B [Cupriavidus taiwanensis]|uniref:Plasmid partition protein B n=1 Tax=Cupriavidus taiwanensis TaxID=164546 RepID=A0A375ECM0_9BURK|nr:ParB/RepB/Spo0J family partition protein [Cupriavidus taiwanensis]SOZ72735.1 Plasmid partition protein B [Cupriavidus taiwanensis]SOZ73432.1 Plasmid partition protein B [Cupriavidus taiwanensis]SOZ75105.1 Plasmid partition protein B [Cupriavidus taiwanensis]SPA03831.1 Plasmid partition protein B [Cupriavidus taiwanensis]SPA11691.1 Plasmid partition protein B [Cupriavidus taiwanensis]